MSKPEEANIRHLEAQLEREVDKEVNAERLKMFPPNLIDHLKEEEPDLYNEILANFSLNLDDKGNLTLKQAANAKSLTESLEPFLQSKEEEVLEKKRVQLEANVQTKFGDESSAKIGVSIVDRKMHVEIQGGTSVVNIDQKENGNWVLSGIPYEYSKIGNVLTDAKIIWRVGAWLKSGKLVNENTPDSPYFTAPFVLNGGKLKWVNKESKLSIYEDSKVQCEPKDMILNLANKGYRLFLVHGPRLQEEESRERLDRIAEFEDEVVNLVEVSRTNIEDIRTVDSFLADEYEEELTSLVAKHMNGGSVEEFYEDPTSLDDSRVFYDELSVLFDGIEQSYYELVDQGDEPVPRTDTSAVASGSSRSSGRTVDVGRAAPIAAATPVASREVVPLNMPLEIKSTEDFGGAVSAWMDAYKNADDGLADGGDGTIDTIYQRMGWGDKVPGLIRTPFHSVELGEDDGEHVTVHLDESKGEIDHSRIQHLVALGGDVPFGVTSEDINNVHIESTVNGDKKTFTWSRDNKTGKDSWCDESGNRLKIYDGTEFAIYGRNKGDAYSEFVDDDEDVSTADVEGVEGDTDGVNVEGVDGDENDESGDDDGEVANESDEDDADEDEAVREELEGGDFADTLATLNQLRGFGTLIDVPSVGLIKKALLDKTPPGMNKATVSVKILGLDVRNGVANLRLAYIDPDSGETAERNFVGVSNLDVNYNRGVGEDAAVGPDSQYALRDSRENKNAVSDLFRGQIFDRSVNGVKSKDAGDAREKRVVAFRDKALEEAQHLGTLRAKAGTAKGKRKEGLDKRVTDGYEKLKQAVAVLKDSEVDEVEAAVATIKKDIEAEAVA